MSFGQRVLACAALLLAGCSSQQTIEAPQLTVPEQFSQVDGALRSNVAIQPVQWWTLFEDPQLDRLMATALSDNFSLKAAANRMEQAQALVSQIASSSGVGLSASADGEQGWQSGSSTEQFQAGLMMSYEIDLWSSLAAAEQAAQFDYMASQRAVDIASITLSADVAGSWFELLTQQALVELYREQLEMLNDQLSVMTLRFQYGQGERTDLLQQQETIERVRAEEQLAVDTHKSILQQLALLTGTARFEPKALSALPDLPSFPAVGLSSNLLYQRPDIQQAWYVLQSQNQQLIVAEAQRLPQVQLTASLFSSDSLGELFSQWSTTLAASLTASLLDGGYNSAYIAQQKAAVEESVNNYSQVVLEAFSEIETALINEQSEQKQLESIDRQLSLAHQTEEIKLARYGQGNIAYLEVLTAQNSRLELEKQRVLSHGSLLGRRIQVYRALAGSTGTPQESSNNDGNSSSMPTQEGV